MSIPTSATTKNNATDASRDASVAGSYESSAAKVARLQLRLRNVLRRNSDDLHACSACLVHAEDHILILHRWITLHENNLVRTRFEALLETRCELFLGHRLAVDFVRAPGHHLKYGLVGRLLHGVRLRRRIRQL